MTTSENRTRYYPLYRSSCNTLIAVFVCAVLNCFFFWFSDSYFVLAPYESTLLLGIGYGIAMETYLVLYYIVGAVFAVMLAALFLVCGILAKKTRGWLLAGTIIYGVDLVLMLPDVVGVVREMGWVGLLVFAADLVIHVLILVILIITLVKCPTVPENPADAVNDAEEATDDTAARLAALAVNEDGTFAEAEAATRQLTVVRKKSFVGCAVPFNITVNGRLVLTLKNGASGTVTVPADAFALGGILNNNGTNNTTEVPGGLEDVTYEVSMKMGMLMNEFVFTKI